MDKDLSENNKKAVKDMLKQNKKKALSLAVAITVGTFFTAGCSNVNKTDESSYLVGSSSRDFSQSSPAEPSGSNGSGSYGGFHYFGGGSYYYGRGATYRQGSWGSSPGSSFGKSGSSSDSSISKGGFSGGKSTSGIGG
jgi:hypothetical protein